MTDIIINWVKDRLGVILDESSGSLSSKFSNGFLIARILNSYSIITDEQLQIILSADRKNLKKCEDNFKKYIRVWLKNIDVHLNENEISAIVHGNGSEALHLVYEIYLELKDVSCLNFISKQRKMEKLRPSSNRFEVERVRESFLENYQPYNHTSSKLIKDNFDIVHWHKDRLQILLQKCREVRENYLDTLQSNCDKKNCLIPSVVVSVESDVCNEVESVDENYDDLFQQKIKILNTEPYEENRKKADEMVNKLKARKKAFVEKDVMKKEIHSELLSQLWKKLKNDKKEMFNDSIKEKLLEQSLFEKQMIKILTEVKMQKDLILRNRRTIGTQRQKEQERHFITQFMMAERDVSEKKLKYYIEKERILKLHKKIYEEKQKLKTERTYEMCLDIIKDMVDLALKQEEYKEEFGIEAPRRVRENWKVLFVKQQPIFDLVQPTEKIITCKMNEEIDEEMETIITREIDRQNYLDHQEFMNYIKYQETWNLSRLGEIEEELLYELDCGMNVVGNAVHQLLLLKYPKPIVVKPNLEHIKIAACVNGLEDTSCLPVLQRLLNYKKVKVIELQDCLNFCVTTYKEESTREYPETVIEEEPDKIVNEKDKKKKEKDTKVKEVNTKGKKSKPDQSATEEKPNEENVPKFSDKIVQTPKLFPEQQINLSEPAKLGFSADEELCRGEPLTDWLIVAMFLEYLKSIPDIEGFVLINFPTNFKQAALLEEALNGIPVLKKEENKMTLETSLAELVDLEERFDAPVFDKDYETRKSVIVPNPEPDYNKPFYDTFLTAYIKIMFRDSDDNGEIELPPAYKALENPPDPLDKFYAELGCNYSLYYKKFDVETVKYLGKLIIGDFTLPLKCSVDLFGETSTFVDVDHNNFGGKLEKDKDRSSKIGDKKEKPKEKKTVVKEEKKDKAKDKSSKGKKEVTAYEDKATQVTVEEEEDVCYVEEVKEPFPGEKDWEYINIEINNDLGKLLATLWENVEEVYVIDFKQVMFFKRILLDAFVSYSQFVKNHMEVFITKPDNKQYVVTNFQRIYNEFDQDFRSDREFKAEIHCRIQELRENLLEICDQNMQQAESERKRIINDNWVPHQIIELNNNALCGFQLEIDRMVDTCQLINDYYSCMITKMPNPTILPKYLLGKMSTNFKDIFEEVTSTLTNFDEDLHCSIFHTMIEQELFTVREFIVELEKATFAVMEKVMAIFSPKGKKGGKEKPPLKVQKKSENPFKGDKVNISTLFEPDHIAFENSSKIAAEWQTALVGEILRAKFHVELLQLDVIGHIKDSLSLSRNTIKEIFDQIKHRYETEINAVDTVCSVFKRAVEEEVPIQEELILNADKFFVEPMSVMFPNPMIIPPPRVEIEYENIFSIKQLDKLVDIFFDLAPSGYIIERSFCFIIQDLVTCDSEDGNKMVPKLWKELTPKNIEVMTHMLFDKNEYVEWKDFINLNLMILYPDEEELLKLRSEFRSYDVDKKEYITDYQYDTIKFWYEENMDKQRLKLMKKLIFKLYRVKENLFNYTAFLLNFCKDENPQIGFTKALEVSMGKKVCWNNEIGKKFVNIILKERSIHVKSVLKRDEEIKDNIEMADSILSDLVDRSVHLCDSVVLEDYTSKDESVKDADSLILEYAKKIMEEECEEDEFQGFYKESFSNIEIGFEAQEYQNLVYFLPFEVLITVVTTILPWNAKVQNISDSSFRELVEEIYMSCRNSEFNNKVLCHEFLNHPQFLDIFNKTNRFKYYNMVDVIENIIN